MQKNSKFQKINVQRKITNILTGSFKLHAIIIIKKFNNFCISLYFLVHIKLFSKK